MSIEQALAETTAALRALATILQSGGAIASATPAVSESVQAEPEKKPRATKKDKTEAGNAATTEPKSADSAPSATQQPATASAATSAATDAGPAFAAVTAKIVELNKSTKPGHGRDGVLNVLARFLGDAAGKRMPDLEALDKNDEIITYVDGLLAGPAAEDDLGL